MAQRFPEPQTEEEARAIERFLKTGAETTLEVRRTFSSLDRATVEPDQPATLSFEDSSERMLGLMEDNSRLVLDLDFTEANGAESFFIHLFTSTKRLTAEVLPEDSSYSGGIAFFCHTDEQGNFVCVSSGHGELKYRLDITNNVRRLEDASEPIEVTAVLVPYAEKTVRGASATFRGELVIVDSFVK